MATNYRKNKYSDLGFIDGKYHFMLDKVLQQCYYGYNLIQTVDEEIKPKKRLTANPGWWKPEK